MNVGKTLFAQVMAFVPWKTFGRIIERHRGDAGVRTLGCAHLFRVMAFAQITWRESLRDIEVCLTANQAKLFHMGLKAPPARSTLADALNLRDWRIYYALDSTTIDLCLSRFDWAPFRSTQAAIKLHALLDLRGAIPSFMHISDGTMHDVNVLGTSCRWRPEPSPSWIGAMWTSSACTRCIRRGPSSSPAPSRTWMRGACTRTLRTEPVA
jgi:hypothetical protein